MNIFTAIKKAVYYLWIISVVVLGLLFVFKNQYFHPEFLSDFISRFSGQIWLIYTLVSFIRGFFLIPSTPFVILGIVMFPDQPWAVLGVSMSGVAFSATLLYFYSDNIGFSTYLEEKYPEQSNWMKEKLGGKWQFPFIYGWSIFPPVPTDLICYVTGILKIRYFVMMAGVFLGELTLNTMYVFMGQKVLEWMY
ncbi:MAG: hypothetical protein GY751_18965 [Bacteroidetes bacterium]|nr:hypothetical protein [Bacteroidota bacterium]